MYFNDIIKEGYVKEKSKNLGILKRRWLVLRKASSRGLSRLQVFHDEETANDGVKMIREYTMAKVHSVTKVAPNRAAYGFFVNTDSSQMFVCETGSEAEEWEEMLQNAIRCGDSISLVESSTQSTKNVFRACLLMSSKLSCSGECLIHIGSEHLRLLDADHPERQLASWPLTTLRRYGSEAETFTFESGRSCDTGEGLFCLSTVHAEAIHHAVKSATVAFAAAYRIGQMDEQQKRIGLTKSMSVPEVSKQTTSHTTVCETKSTPTTSVAGRVPMPTPRSFTQDSSSSSSSGAEPLNRRRLPQLPVPEVIDTPPDGEAPKPPAPSPRSPPLPPQACSLANPLDEQLGERLPPTTDDYEAYLHSEFRKFLDQRLKDM